MTNSVSIKFWKARDSCPVHLAIGPKILSKTFWTCVKKQKLVGKSTKLIWNRPKCFGLGPKMKELSYSRYDQ